MKTQIHIIIFSLIAAFTYGQDWTWVRGGTTGSIAGVYGTQGTASASNDPGGRHGSATWTDKSGNLWVFGGEGFSNTSTLCWLNDLWKYNPTTNQWTWMRGSNGPDASGVYGTQGVASPLNDPGAREFAMCWTDTAGNFWLFGGDGFDGTGTYGRLADLWRYNPATNQWTFVHGFAIVDQYGVYGTMGTASSLNMPGGRMGGGYWRDNNNNLWLFGGDGYASTGSAGKLNDLWKYVPSTNQWTWIKGSNLITQVSTYGTFSVAATGNTPGGRSFPACWYSQGQMYLFGGVGHANSTNNNRLGEFWRYDPSTNNWTWIGGAAAGNQNGNYDTQGVPSTANIPGSRFSAASWTDPVGNLWLFGGNGYPGQGSPGLLNDLFKYNPSSSAWTWVKGDTITYAISNYGTQGVKASSNKPGARMYNSWWNTGGSRLWLVGGEERNDTTFLNDHLNDLWVFDSPCNPDSVHSLSGQILCSGETATLSVVPIDNSGVTWYATATSTAALGSGTTFVTPTLSSGGSGTTYTYYVSVTTCSQSARTAVTITALPSPIISVSAPSVACENAPLSFTATGAQTYTWNPGNSVSAVYTATAPAGAFSTTVTGTDANGCRAISSASVLVNAASPVTVTGPTTACAGSQVTFTATGAVNYMWANGSAGSLCTVLIGPNGSITYVGPVAGTDANGCTSYDSLAVTSNPSPTVNVATAGTVVCNTNAATFTASGASSYSWSTGQTSNVMTHTAFGYMTYTFTVTGTGTNGCSSTDTVSYLRSECIGLEDQDHGVLSIYPNPSEGAFIIEFPVQSASGNNIAIFNNLGQLLLSRQLKPGESRIEMSLPSGIYHCSLVTKEGVTYQSKLVIR